MINWPTIFQKHSPELANSDGSDKTASEQFDMDLYFLFWPVSQ